MGETIPSELRENQAAIEAEIGKLYKRLELNFEENRESTEVEAEVNSALHEMNVPFSKITVERDLDRTDERRTYVVGVKIPNSWPGNTSRQGERTLWFRSPENTESKEHLE